MNRVFATEKAKESVTEAGQRLEDSISRLREVLNKKDAIKETEINFDREEKLVSNWQAQTKELDKSHLPDFKKPSARSWSGMKLKIFTASELKHFLPVNNKLRVQGGLNTPLSLKRIRDLGNYRFYRIGFHKHRPTSIGRRYQQPLRRRF